jgi:asparagine synthetase B (glutamine-hydrolysing)
MSGIGGIFHLRGSKPGELAVRAMAAHHHADSQLINGSVGLVGSDVYDDDVRVVLDGWIDDVDDLVRRAGHTTGVESASHAVAIAYRKWGIGLFDRLDGEFSVAIWEPEPRRLILARDRMGTRPLFWTRSDNGFAFATSLPALLDLPWVDRVIARENLSEYLSFGTVHAPRTLVQDVYQVEPAHWLRIDVDELKSRRWWRPH